MGAFPTENLCDVTGTGSGEPEVSIFPPKFKFSRQNSNWPMGAFPTENLSINPKNQSEAAFFIQWIRSIPFWASQSSFDLKNQWELVLR